MDHGLPREYTDRMRRQLASGFDKYIKCFDKPSCRALRMNRRKVSAVDYASVGRISTGSDVLEKVEGIDGAFYYYEGSPGKSPYHAAGGFYIQEPSAMYPATLLDIGDSPLKVLDLCASPGGKTSQIADMMNDQGLLVTNEVIPSRAKILSENVERMGIKNALVISSDPDELAVRFEGYFDRILVDAPCSGEGMFRKNPEAVNAWSPENVEMCAKRQDWL
ncbi:MAG: RsmB/NOP family class I SAM-dependent RNA methyltransferase, partial [Lachnospiraceae bacterium]|nr:RsmB/NOP family class I SAM-dependent RNA methyltransferase [Lachnospiraceae bacterium]